MSLDLVYNPIHQVVVCRRCQTCLVPRQSSVERHLRGEPHRLLGPALKAHLAYIDALTLRDLETLKRDRPKEPVTPIEHLPVHAGFRCLLCPPPPRRRSTRSASRECGTTYLAMTREVRGSISRRRSGRVASSRPTLLIMPWLFGYKRCVPLLIPVTSLFCSRSIPNTWVYAQNGNDGRPTLIEDT